MKLTPKRAPLPDEDEVTPELTRAPVSAAASEVSAERKIAAHERLLSALAGASGRRSWYLPTETSERLSEELRKVHFATELPKHVILAAMLETAIDNLTTVTKVAENAHRRSKE